MTKALLIIDVQNDFCRGGTLAVPEADTILPAVNALVRGARRVFLSQDWHPEGHVSFASSHPGTKPFECITLPTGEQMLWPDHCIAGTHGATLHPALEVPADATVVRKGTDRHRDAYSAFHGRDRSTSEGLDGLLRRAAVDEILLCGLATDYCVLHTALDARAHGYAVTVVESACRGIDADGSLEAAWSRMTAAGVRRTWTAPRQPEA